jgi:hypothetical protein
MVACSAKTETKSATNEEPTTIKPRIEFNADSAYRNVKTQVDFGPRVPGLDSHAKCAQYLAGELRRYGADEVIEQKTTVTAFNGDKLPVNNILGQFNKDAVTRVLLLAHWDTRPWGDEDADENKRKSPIPGANDGASGVGVLLEVARCLSIEKPAIGVDILFVDAEDYGEHADHDEPTDGIAWCLGSQYWARVPHVDGYMARFGILLDMVGGRDARFHREGLSDYFARPIVDKVWAAAHASGHGQWFPYAEGGQITDDHLPINQLARIPCIDIIGHYPETGFAPTWHTMDDTMENIDPAVLRAVGQTVLQVIYNEK